jgi:hypothetical protein
MIFIDNQADIETFQNPASRSRAYVVVDETQLIDKPSRDRDTTQNKIGASLHRIWETKLESC